MLPTGFVLFQQFVKDDDDDDDDDDDETKDDFADSACEYSGTNEIGRFTSS